MMSMTDADAPDAAAMAPPSCSDALRGCTCFIDITNAGGLNATPVFTKRVLALGAAVVERLSSKVTHVVFKGTTDALRALHDRLARLPANGTGARHVVSVTWVAACTDAFARVDETPHEQARPADTLASLVKSPTYHRGGGSNSSKKRKAMEPLPTQRYGACVKLLLPQGRACVWTRRGESVTNQQLTLFVLHTRAQRLTSTTRHSLRLRCWRSCGLQTWGRSRRRQPCT